MTQKILVSLPDDLARRVKLAIPSKKRSQVIASLLSREIGRLEKNLYQIALEVEKDTALNQEMDDWRITLGDGLDHETW